MVWALTAVAFAAGGVAGHFDSGVPRDYVTAVLRRFYLHMFIDNEIAVYVFFI